MGGLPVAAITPGTGAAVYYHHDVLGSMAAVTQTGTAGPADLYTYSEFGGQGAGSWTTYRFAGYRYDAETGLYYVRARYYSPIVGRFLQTDPIGYAGGTNLYAYTGNDPVNLTDPSGLYAIIVVNGNTITITLPAVFAGAGLTPERQTAITNAIQTAWTGIFASVGQFGPSVVTTTVVAPAANPPAGQVNTITVLDQIGVSATNSVGGNSSTIYTQYPGYPPYTMDQFGATAAHEAGHLMGDRDYYTTQVVNGTIVPTTNPGYEDNLMATITGQVDARNIGVILNSKSNDFQPPGGANAPTPGK